MVAGTGEVSVLLGDVPVTVRARIPQLEGVTTARSAGLRGLVEMRGTLGQVATSSSQNPCPHGSRLGQEGKPWVSGFAKQPGEVVISRKGGLCGARRVAGQDELWSPEARALGC